MIEKIKKICQTGNAVTVIFNHINGEAEYTIWIKNGKWYLTDNFPDDKPTIADTLEDLLDKMNEFGFILNQEEEIYW